MSAKRKVVRPVKCWGWAYPLLIGGEQIATKVFCTKQEAEEERKIDIEKTLYRPIRVEIRLVPPRKAKAGERKGRKT